MGILNKFIKTNMTCDEELNIFDIDDNVFYSLDGYLSIYIKVTPIPFEYLSNSEKSRMIKRLNMELAGERGVIKIIVMSLPVSTKKISDYLTDKRNSVRNAFKRRFLLREIEDINRLSYKGEMIEKQVVIQLFQKEGDNAEQDLKKRGKEFMLRLKNAGISSEMLDNREILQFFNSFLNLRFSNNNFDNVWSDESFE